MAKDHRTTIKFEVPNKIIVWVLDNNLYRFGLSIQDAFHNWSARVKEKDIKPENFCDYVVSKDRINLRCTVFRAEEKKF